MKRRESMRSVTMLLLSLMLGSVLGCSLAPGTSNRESEPQPKEPLSEVFKRVSPAVAVIFAEQSELSPDPTARVRVQAAGIGSGIYIRGGDKPLLFTAAHVVQAADRILVQFKGLNHPIPAEVVSSSQATDSALLRLEVAPPGIFPAQIADSGTVEVGDQCFVVGAPSGLAHTMTVGHVSARRGTEEVVGGVAQIELFQTDAAINPGNSGGPMFNERGEVIGIVSHILTHSGGFEGLGFAVTSNVARRVLLESAPFWTGLEFRVLSGEIAQVLNVPQPTALLVNRVAKDSPASRLGLKAGTVRATIGAADVVLGGDIVLSVFDIPATGTLENLNRIQQRIQAIPPTGAVRLTILRGGEVLELEKPFTQLIN